jgi:hypothetical protein
MIGFGALKLYTGDSDKNSSTLIKGLLMTGFISIVFPVFVGIFLYKNLSKLKDDKFKERFDSLYLNIETTSKRAYLSTFFFLVRRFFLAHAVVFAFSAFHYQALVSLFSSLLMGYFYLRVRPFEE